jgi:hypothetical protein
LGAELPQLSPDAAASRAEALETVTSDLVSAFRWLLEQKLTLGRHFLQGLQQKEIRSRLMTVREALYQTRKKWWITGASPPSVWCDIRLIGCVPRIFETANYNHLK